MKKTNIIIRISEKDKEDVKRMAEERQMTMSEFVTFLIRREADKTLDKKQIDGIIRRAKIRLRASCTIVITSTLLARYQQTG